MNSSRYSRNDDRFRQEEEFRGNRNRDWGGRSGDGQFEGRGDYQGQGRNQNSMDDNQRSGRHGGDDHFERADSRLTAYDEDYANFRNDHLTKLDDDYQEWRSERRKQFQQEFDKWRTDKSGKTAASGTSGKSGS